MKGFFYYIGLYIIFTLLVSCTSTDVVLKNRSIIPENFSTEAFLRTENGNHAAKITRIGIDAKEKYLVSAGEDKTIRVWDIEDGSFGRSAGIYLNRVIRPPIAGGKEGRLNAIAISPDASIVVASGWTGKWESGKPHIYVFETQTGKMIQSYEVEEQVFHLAFSDNGQYLAATLEGSNRGVGFVLYKINNNQLEKIQKGSDYNSDSYWATFYKKGSAQYLAVSCFDGKIRIYSVSGNSLNNERIIATENGSKPYSIAISSDSEELAVGYSDTPNIDVYSLKNYQYLFSPSSSGISNRDSIGKVAYSGNKLFAGGNFENAQGQVLLRIWQDKGKGSFTDIPISEETVMHLIPSSLGNLWVASADPFIGKIQNDRISFSLLPQKANFSHQFDNFAISHDAKEIRFSYNPKDSTKYYFNLTGKSLELAGNSSNLKTPFFNNLPNDKWSDKEKPYIYREIKLREGEISRSLAFHPDTNNFALGTEWNIYYTDKTTGINKWKIPIPSVAWVVNISGDGKYVVAALGDGTIRWYKTENGEELIAFFPHPDKKRWAIWTPQGFYDCSVDGEEFVGWHVNNAKDKEADFFPIARFRDAYFRPDILSKVLGKESVAVAMKEADKENGDMGVTMKSGDIYLKSSGTKVEILNPAHKTPYTKGFVKFKIAITVTDKKDIQSITVIANETKKIYSEDAENLNIKSTGEQNRYEIDFKAPIDIKHAKIIVSVTTKYSEGTSEPIHIYEEGTISNQDLIKPNLYLLSIGVGKFKLLEKIKKKNDKFEELKYTQNDVKDFTEIMAGNPFYNKINSEKLENQSREEIIQKLHTFFSKAEQDDISIVFLSGHGSRDPIGHYYFLPNDYDPEKIFATAIPGIDILVALSKIKGKVILFLDTCYSGNLADENLTHFINTSRSPSKRVIVFSSSSAIEQSVEFDGNGLFTKALKNGLMCSKAEKDINGNISLTALKMFILKEVPELMAMKKISHKQSPIIAGDNSDPIIKAMPPANSCK
jgi:WD40 repeat protein